MEIKIENLEDVLPFVNPETGIIHSIHQGYSVINYVFTVDETFSSPIAHECRGLKFAPDGTLIARPFHKFFNLGEKRPPQEEPWEMAHVILDKLDGSMIHPAVVNDELVFMTRMGISEQANDAFQHAGSNIKNLCMKMIESGFTPIFEFTSPDNRIVVEYEEASLTLLAIRHMHTGKYMLPSELHQIGREYGVPVVKSFGSVGDVASFWKDARALKDVEGYVIAFDNGHRLKIKADAYVLKHKALGGLEHEKNVLAWVATETIDDVIPLLSPQDAEQVLTYQEQLMSSLSKWETEIGQFVSQYSSLPRKEFAAKAKELFPASLQSVAFRSLDGNSSRDALMDILKRASGSGSKVDSIRSIFNMDWTPPKKFE